MNTAPRDEKESSAEGQTDPADKEDEQSVTACVGPGTRLREAREKLGLNRAKAGQQLGLTETSVKDLETNHFDRFASGVYVRGYLKNYAKMLGESEEEIIRIHDQFCLEQNLDSGKNTLNPLPERTGPGRLAKALIGLGIVMVLLVVVFGNLL